MDDKLDRLTGCVSIMNSKRMNVYVVEGCYGHKSQFFFLLNFITFPIECAISHSKRRIFWLGKFSPRIDSDTQTCKEDIVLWHINYATNHNAIKTLLKGGMDGEAVLFHILLENRVPTTYSTLPNLLFHVWSDSGGHIFPNTPSNMSLSGSH